VREDRKGLLFARIRGVLESQGQYVCFLDDDNVPVPGYVAEGVEAFADSSTGMLVSRVFPRYLSGPVPPSIVRREHLLAMNHRLGDAVIRFGGLPTLAPTLGAGLWFRRDLFLRVIPWQHPERLLVDRQGTKLTSGGDIEFGYLFGAAGHDRVYRPKLRVDHLVPPTRLASKYFCRLIVGTVRSELTLKAKYVGAKAWMQRTAGFFWIVVALVAAPRFLCSKDGLREYLFAIARRWGQLLGPFPISESPRFSGTGKDATAIPQDPPRQDVAAH
jgi:glycosyltransferase involved in cell wall biosynthesis